MVNKIASRQIRRKRIRDKVEGTKLQPRLSVFRSNKHIYTQIIDDEKGLTLVSANDLELVKKGTSNKAEKISKAVISEKVGELLAEKSLKKKIDKVVFDRSGYKYHGRVKAVAEGARKKGLKF
ncbi:MAG: 50S ribosomal protein L18 [Microgenomates group bacterium GW2011_GWC1_37_8]|uniref:Large ribosomal subunit protein uL18 n=1 Tax=Candidatus Woesebacteria bacterium GW2011_GWB1_38_8 TaxID=1618570 RepID=A0A0G0P9J6_9BACT|nr:MAG: 50S ribosomal protein L18 [Microgenomates group bacterium GW2011_GWC1_37_8]KKQ86006.1 MAG: 50S ribosomal protein L18 [Candidatus Woesebacteria bacterium GW2011_GWB1_38_8]